MSYKAITTIVHFLSIIINRQHQEVKLISDLNSFFNFDHTAFLLHSSAEIDRFVANGPTPQTLYVFDSAGDGNVTGLETLTEIGSKNTFMVVVPESAHFEGYAKLLNQVEKLQATKERLHINIKIGVFFKQFVGEKDLQKLFEWFWGRGITNVFAATYPIEEDSLTIFTFNPFGTFQVINVAASESYDDFFLNQNCNFQQHTLRLGEPYNRLSDEKLWLVIFSLVNATFVTVGSDEASDIKPILYYISSRKREFMYPIKQESEVVVVPQSLPYSEFSAYLQSITSGELFVYSLITIAAVTVYLSIIRYIKQRKIIFFQSVADVLNLLLNDNGAIKYQQLSRTEVFIIVPLTFVGFIIVNGIFSNLQSYLNRPIFQPQMDDIEEIHQSPLRITTLNTGWQDTLIGALQDQSTYTDWRDKTQVLDVYLLDAEINKFNTSISFLWNRPTVQCALRVQKRLNIRGYHITKANIYNQHLTYLLNRTFPFMERFDDIALRTKSSGLYDKWLQWEHAEYESEVLKNNWHRRNYAEREIERFSFPMFIVYGWIAGIVVLMVEIGWKKCNVSTITFT